MSPLLANTYLHYVLDPWAQRWRTKVARGDVVLVRYADDFIVGFQHREDAEQFRRALSERLAKFRLELHPDKTCLIAFGKFARRGARDGATGRRPGTSSFLGFTHICGRSRSGRFLLRRQTERKRMTAKLHEVATGLRRRRHQPIPEQGRCLGSVVRGHIAYYGVPTNGHMIGGFRTQVVRLWHRVLTRRSQRHRLPWARMGRLASSWLPPARISHPWPSERFDVKTRGKSPVR